MIKLEEFIKNEEYKFELGNDITTGIGRFKYNNLKGVKSLSRNMGYAFNIIQYAMEYFDDNGFIHGLFNDTSVEVTEELIQHSIEPLLLIAERIVEYNSEERHSSSERKVYEYIILFNILIPVVLELATNADNPRDEAYSLLVYILSQTPYTFEYIDYIINSHRIIKHIPDGKGLSNTKDIMLAIIGGINKIRFNQSPTLIMNLMLTNTMKYAELKK